MPLIDPFGRQVSYLRISVTDRCNLRCRYCMPSDVKFMDRVRLLTYEEIARFVRVAAREGIRKIRITGGEPLVRKSLPELVRQIADAPGIEELALSTNALLFAQYAAELKAAGLQRVNISLDSLHADRFERITGADKWREAMDGIEAALAVGLHPVKINAVLMAGVNDDEIGEFVAWAKREPVHIRFIEYMPIGTYDDWERERVIPRDRVLQLFRSHVDLEPIVRDREVAGPAEEYRIRGGRGSIGLITAVTNEFCEACNRIRLTSDGKLRGCLISNGEVDLRAPLREGVSDEALRALLHRCIRQKPEKHLINDEESTDSHKPDRPSYQMHQLGG